MTSPNDGERVPGAQQAVEAAGVGAFEWDLRTGELRFDGRLLEVFGLGAGGFGGTIDAFNERVHPEDRPRVRAAIQSALDECGHYAAEYRIVLPDGGVRWVAARGRAVPGEDGRPAWLLGAAYDTTAVQEGEARVARVLEAMPSAFFHLRPDWRFGYVNAEAERLLGATRQQLLGEVIWELFPAAVGSDFEEHYRRAAATGEPTTFEAYYPDPLDGWFEVRAWPSPDGLAVYFLDVTDRRATEQALDRQARRNELLADVSADLTGTLEGEEAVARLASLMVPALGDWSVVTMVGEGRDGNWRSRLRDIGWAHADPASLPLVQRYAETRPGALEENSFVARTVAGEGPITVREGAAEAVRKVLAPGEASDLLARLDPGSLAIAPLRGRDRIVGLLTLFRDRGREPFTDDEVEVLADIASRAGLSLDNARLYAEQRDLAEGLQRSLLTAPPETQGLQLAVRYEPAARAAQVGGDWYDAFRQGEGVTVLVIGDVVGHDTAAAAAMGQVRGLLRGIAAHTGEGPAAVLRGVDQVMQTLEVDTTATAVIARVEVADPRAAAALHGVPAPVQLRWSNAGHPPPFAVTTEGEVRTLAAPQADLLLGLDPAAPRVESAVELTPGTTVLFYTDGLVERRSQSIDEGLARLEALLSRLGTQGLGLEELCDRLLEEMVPGDPGDDVALVAVRVD